MKHNHDNLLTVLLTIVSLKCLVLSSKMDENDNDQADKNSLKDDIYNNDNLEDRPDMIPYCAEDIRQVETFKMNLSILIRILQSCIRI